MLEIVNIKKILDKIFENKRSLIVTFPSNKTWNDYEEDLKKVANKKQVFNFKVHDFPNGIEKGDRCYIVYKNIIKGWIEIIDFVEKNISYKKVKFIEQGGEFHPLKEELPYKNFQGFRYFDLSEYKLKNNIK